MCTSTASIGGSQFIGDPSICGVTGPLVGGDDVVPHEQSAPIIIVLESDHRSSYASPCDPSMTDSQSHECHCLSGSTPSLRSVCLAPSLLSSPHSSVSVVGGLDPTHPPPPLMWRSRRVNLPVSRPPVSRSGLPHQECAAHNLPRLQQTSPQPM